MVRNVCKLLVGCLFFVSFSLQKSEIERREFSLHYAVSENKGTKATLPEERISLSMCLLLKAWGKLVDELNNSSLGTLLNGKGIT